MNISKGKKLEPQKIVIYGPEGIGKSTICSKFPEPLYIDTEGSTGHLDIRRFDKPSSFTMLLEQIKYVRDNSMVCGTLIIDTADWAEMLCINEFCAKKQITGIEDIGYGKGYVYIAEDFGKMLNLLEEVKLRGVNIVITAHAQMRKFEQPDEIGAYDRWELKLQKKIAPILKEWCDMLLFANYKTTVVNVDGNGAVKGKNKAQGGKRVMYTEHNPCWDAKNRHELPSEIPLDYAAIEHCIPTSFDQSKEIESTKQGIEKVEVKEPVEVAIEKELKLNIPKALAELIESNDVTIEDIQDVVSLRGYYPKGTPVAKYDLDFINGVLVGAWEKVYGMIREMKLKRGDFVKVEEGMQEEMPFN